MKKLRISRLSDSAESIAAPQGLWWRSLRVGTEMEIVALWSEVAVDDIEEDHQAL